MKNSSKQITKSKAAAGHAAARKKKNTPPTKSKGAASGRSVKGTSTSSRASSGPRKKAAANGRKKMPLLKAPPAIKRSTLKTPPELLVEEAAKKKKKPAKVNAGERREPTTPSTISSTSTKASSTGGIREDLAGFGLTTPSPLKKSRSKSPGASAGLTTPSPPKKSRSKSPGASAARALSVEFKAATSATKKGRVVSAKKKSEQAKSEEPNESKDNNKKIDTKFSCANIKWTDHLSILDAADYHLDITHQELLEMPHKKRVKLLLGAFSPKQMLGALVPICIDRGIDWRLVDQDKHFLTRKPAESMLMKILFGNGTL